MKPWNPGSHRPIVSDTHRQLLPPANIKVTIRGQEIDFAKIILIPSDWQVTLYSAIMQQSADHSLHKKHQCFKQFSRHFSLQWTHLAHTRKDNISSNSEHTVVPNGILGAIHCSFPFFFCDTQAGQYCIGISKKKCHYPDSRPNINNALGETRCWSGVSIRFRCRTTRSIQNDIWDYIALEIRRKTMPLCRQEA